MDPPPPTGSPKRRRSSEDLSTVARPVAEPETVPALRMVVIEGPDKGTIFPLDPSTPTRALLGTSPVCGFRLTDPTVSRRHASFEPVGRRYQITDFGSTNGTFVDGVAILNAFVQGGEVVRCGSTALQLERVETAPPKPLPNAMRFGLALGASVAMRRLYPLCERLAKSNVPVIIEGETGTGKENLAEALHEVSGSQGPFVVFDCTAVSPSLLESELFGHERGAFTGAVAARPGVFEQAEGGTLLIDEIGDLDLPLQSKLLRAIDRSEVRRVGGQRTIKVNVRILAATRRDLDREVAAGRFRDDLFHRLAVARIELPPLRERKGDIPLLARFFCQQMGASPVAITPELLARFDDFDWPGNVRELRNTIARVIALGETALETARPSRAAPRPSSASPSPPLSAEPDVERLREACRGTLPFPIARRRVIEEFERAYVETLLAQHGGNVAHAARASGLALRYFQLVRARTKQDVTPSKT
jgi:transcriptional regulator with GAF, ATPase, and Fis domain